MNKELLKTLRIGQDVKINNDLYRVYEINRQAVYLIPITNKVIIGAIATVPDMTRKPLLISKERA